MNFCPDSRYIVIRGIRTVKISFTCSFADTVESHTAVARSHLLHTRDREGTLSIQQICYASEREEKIKSMVEIFLAATADKRAPARLWQSPNQEKV